MRYTLRVKQLKKSVKMFRSVVPAVLLSYIKPRPVWAHLYVTRRCNLECNYCFVRDNRRADSDETRMLQIIDRLYLLGCRAIGFIGGEPTLHKGLHEMIRHANDLGMVTHLSTNGVKLTPAYLRRLGESQLDVINLSIDSLSECSHSGKDYVRSKRIFNDLIEARGRYGFEVTVNLVMTAENIESVVDTVRFIHNYDVPMSIGLIVSSYVNGTKGDESLYFTTAQQRKQLEDVATELAAMRRQRYNIIDPAAYFIEIGRFARGERPKWKCMSGKHSMAVDCDGSYMVCGNLPVESLSIFDLEKHFYSRVASLRTERFSQCTATCLSNCMYDISYFFYNPVSFFIKDLFRRRRTRRTAIIEPVGAVVT